MGDSYRSEYVGFKVNAATRDYQLRVTTPGTEARDFIVAIPNKAFLAHRLSYQDAPDLCFLKLRSALDGCAELAATRMLVTDAELEEYREAHAPPAKKPRPTKYPAPPT